MPSGRTHDRITCGVRPSSLVLPGYTQSSDPTLIVSGAFLFSGLMFGPDLDLHSVQYKRWGPLRLLWIPYQNSTPPIAFVPRANCWHNAAGAVSSQLVRNIRYFRIGDSPTSVGCGMELAAVGSGKKHRLNTPASGLPCL